MHGLGLLPLIGLLSPGLAQEPVDATLNARIRAEALERSQVMATLHPITDVFSPRLTGPSTDMSSFTSSGLPAVGVVQDGLEYFEYTWHTAIDTLDRVPPEDVKRTAAVLASVAIHLAQRPDLPPSGRHRLLGAKYAFVPDRRPIRFPG